MDDTNGNEINRRLSYAIGEYQAISEIQQQIEKERVQAFTRISKLQEEIERKRTEVFAAMNECLNLVAGKKAAA